MYKCRICGWYGETDKLMVREMMQNTKDEFAYFECGNCHCLQIETIPEKMGEYYDGGYYSFETPQIRKEFKNKQEDNTKVLDVGCGAGGFLCGLAEMGFTNLLGCDPFIEKDLEYENGVKIYKRTIHEMEGQFDWIYLNDSFEHVQDPHDVMKSIKRLLAPQGIARVRIPVYPNIAYEMFGTHWFQIDAPRHLFLHTKASMEYLAKEHGLMIVKKEYDSTAAQIIRSFLYSKDIPFWEHTEEMVHQYFEDKDLKEIEELCKKVNQSEYGDHAAFYLIHMVE